MSIDNGGRFGLDFNFGLLSINSEKLTNESAIPGIKAIPETITHDKIQPK
jgi:hypothetical protein